MSNIELLKRLYKDYSKKFLKKILISVFFSVLVAGSTASIAWLLDPAIKKIFIDKDQTLILIIPIFIALGSMPLAFLYPLMKRFTYWPQLFLGITFNYGLILGWTSVVGEISIAPIILYLGAIFWTLGYDTIYGFQDIKDDEIIGVKSTSIKFKNNPKKFLLICYSILVISILTTGLLMNFNLLFFIILIIPILHLFLYQIKEFNSKDKENCLKIFRSNNFFGALILINIFIGKIL